MRDDRRRLGSDEFHLDVFDTFLRTSKFSVSMSTNIMSENPSMHQTNLAQDLYMHLKEKGSLACESMSVKIVASLPALEKTFCVSILPD